MNLNKKQPCFRCREQIQQKPFRTEGTNDLCKTQNFNRLNGRRALLVEAASQSLCKNFIFTGYI